jgi:uncharacterized phage protein gp47/JayE
MSAETPFESKEFGRLLADLLEIAKQGTVPVDDHEGSVARTLLEAFARELAVCYEQLRRVYRFGYIDSAEGPALDKVVALLGLERRRGGLLEGAVRFSRAQAAPEDIPIPPGTRLAGRGVPAFETVEKGAAIVKGEQEAMVKVRALETDDKTVAANALNLMQKPIWGVDTVTNPTPLTPGRREESDDELRERARYWLERVNLGTSDALVQAVRSLGIAQVTVRENPFMAGDVTVLLGDPDLSDDEVKRARLNVERVRPAGVRVEVQAVKRVYVQICATLVLRKDYPVEERKRLRTELAAALMAYCDGLKIGEPVRAAKIEAILTGPSQVAEALGVAGQDKLRAHAIASQGEMTEVTGKYRLLNGDLQIRADERAVLDVDRLPILLTLEPPWLEAAVDVALDGPLDEFQQQSVRNGLQGLLDTCKPGKHLTYGLFNPGNPPLVEGRSIISFTVIHYQNNSAVTLTATGGEDVVRVRERLRVGRLVAAETGHA